MSICLAKPRIAKKTEGIRINDLQVFKSNEFGEIRTIQENGVIWFCGSDVCKALHFTNSRKAVNDHCKKDGVTKRYIIDRLNRKQLTAYINEPNLYRLIIHSRLPSAEKFEKWVFEEVLPAIRRTGRFSCTMKPASIKEVVNLIKVTRETMQDQGKAPEEVATVVKDIGQQFGIRLSRWVVEPEKVDAEDLKEAVDYVYEHTVKGKRKPKFEDFLVHVSVQRLEGGKKS